MSKNKKKKTILRTKGEALKKFVLDRFYYSKEKMLIRQQAWKEYYEDYRGKILATKEPWQSNYVIPTLKEIVRVKIPLYLNILFSAGVESFDVEPGEESDEPFIPLLKSKLVYDLNNTGRNRGGLFGVWGEFAKQYEIYGYSVAKIPWRVIKDKKGKLVFEGPDMEVIDIFNFYPDPGSINLDSWKIIKKDDVFISYLRMMEKQGIYFNIKKLKETTKPARSDEVIGSDVEDATQYSDTVSLLEYHGEVPKSLLEGNIDDAEEVNPYEDDYVDAIVTVANEQVVIRAEEYPYDCGNIFIDACKDRMPNEMFGIGTAEDIQAMARELTNFHNKFSDCVNIIANPMVIVNPQKLSGLSDTLIVRPGAVFTTNPMVDNTAHAITFMDTTAAAAALTPMMQIIKMLDERIQKLSQAVPAITPVSNKKELHPTLGGVMLMQANAAEPIKHEVKHQLEPAFQRMLEIYYKHNLQFFSEASAYRILGREKGRRWIEEMSKRKITKQDIKLSGNPDFIPRGVSVFLEKQIEIRNLLDFWQIAQNAVKPMTDPMGRPVMGADGKPVTEPLVDQNEIIKRFAVLFGFKDVEKLLPFLKEEMERRRIKVSPEGGEKTKIPQRGIPTPLSPPMTEKFSPSSPSGGAIEGIPQR